MRRDILELDTALSARLPAAPPTGPDAEAIRLLLGGNSVIDWHRLHYASLEEVDRFLALHLLDMNAPNDRERIRYVFNEAVSYLEEHLGFRFRPELRDPADIRDLFLWASDTRGFRGKQLQSCIVLKLMHVIHHMEAADLKFKAPISEEAMLGVAYDRLNSQMALLQEEGLPLVSFYGSRKTRSSMITKLLAKKENVAATVFDKLRFRLVVREHEDLLPTLAVLVRRVVPYNYVIPGQSHNNLLTPAHLQAWADAAATADDEAPLSLETGKNEFSGRTYQMINFIADYPIRLPSPSRDGFPFELGQTIFVMVEFQIVDEATAHENERGENAHFLYKRRQHRVVERRLTRGLPNDPPSE